MPAAIPLIAGTVVASYAGAAAAFVGLATVAANVVGALAGGLVAVGTSKLLGLDEIKQQRPPGPEINVRGAVAGIDVRDPGRKLPGFGRVGP